MIRVLEVNVDDVGLSGVYALVTSVIRHRPDGLKVDIACIAEFENPDNVRALNRMGTDVRYIGTSGSKLSRPRAYYGNLLRLLRERRYDCVHIHGDVAYLLLIFARAARRAGVDSVILHSHAAGVDGGSRRLKLILHRLARPFLARSATRFAACSDRAAQWMYPFLGSDGVAIVNNGIEVERYAYDAATRERMRAELKLDGCFVVGHVGRFAYQKNHEYLLDAFAAIRRRIPNARLLMVGEGVLFDRIREKSSRLALERDVIFYGASYDVGSLLQAMDLFLLPSHFEGLPVVGVEAQAAGLPVIFSDSVTRQADLSGRAWFLPAEASAVERWAERAQAVAAEEADRSKGREAVERAGFTVGDTVRGFLELYGFAPGEGGVP